MHSRIELSWWDDGGFSPTQLLDHGQHSLPRQDAFALQQFHRGRDLPHVEEGQLFEGDDFFGVEGVQSRSPDNFGGT